MTPLIAVVTILFCLIAILMICLVLDARRRRNRRKKAPEAVWWIGPASDPGYAPIGIRIDMEALEQRLPFLSGNEDGQFIEILNTVQKVCGVERIDPVVVVFRAVPALVLADGHPAAGIYHTTDEWDRPWIELAVGLAPKTLRDTAFAHELLHHVSGLGDTAEFRVLYRRLQEALT